MKPIDVLRDESVWDMVERMDPCARDDLVSELPHFSWGHVFAAVDRMSRDGRLVIRRRGDSTYQIALPQMHHGRR
jgi:hypothetical protein